MEKGKATQQDQGRSLWSLDCMESPGRCALKDPGHSPSMWWTRSPPMLPSWCLGSEAPSVQLTDTHNCPPQQNSRGIFRNWTFRQLYPLLFGLDIISWVFLCVFVCFGFFFFLPVHRIKSAVHPGSGFPVIFIKFLQGKYLLKCSCLQPSSNSCVMPLEFNLPLRWEFHLLVRGQSSLLCQKLGAMDLPTVPGTAVDTQ